jgi:hypothetical protein
MTKIIGFSLNPYRFASIYSHINYIVFKNSANQEKATKILLSDWLIRFLQNSMEN